jgi:ribosomal protein S18 acetylase RimI-like enzyme
MTRALRIIPAAAVTLDEFAGAYTAAFMGYFYHQAMNRESLARRVRTEQIDLVHSLLAYDEDELVGMAMLGIRGQSAWIGGFGITERHRGRGRSHELMAAVVGEVCQCGMKKLSLEVLPQNAAAIRTYERAGLKVVRELLIFDRTHEPPPASVRTETLEEAAPAELTQHFARLHLQPPAWQRDLPTQLTMDNMRGFYLGRRQAPVAYALVRTWPSGITFIVDLAAREEQHADAMCAGITQMPGPLRIINEPEKSIFVTALQTHGFIETERQHEMVMDL